MKSKKSIQEELDELRSIGNEARKEMRHKLTNSCAECLAEDMVDIAITEAQCEILEWVLESRKDAK